MPALHTDYITPEDVPLELQEVASLLRRATSNSDVYEAPSPFLLHQLFQACLTPMHFTKIIQMLDRRLDFNDANYKSVQTCKTLWVIKNGLYSAPEAFVDHYSSNRSLINDLRFVNPRYSSDSKELMSCIHREAQDIVTMLSSPGGLTDTRKSFSYKGIRPRTDSGIDKVVADFTGKRELQDPQRMLESIYAHISEVTDRAVIIDMIERRLNPYDANYSCPQLQQALKIIMHCLTADRAFLRYWVDHPESVFRLSGAKCGHGNPRCSESDYMEESRAFSLIILGKLTHQVDLDNSPRVVSPEIHRQTDSPPMRNATPPPPSKAVITAQELIEGTGIQDYTMLILRTSLHPEAQGAFSDVYKENLQCEDRVPIQIAVKVVRTFLRNDQDASHSIKRLKNELAIWVKLDHKYINPLIGISFSHSKSPAFVSPWCEGGTLLGFLKRNPRTNLLALFHRIAQGVQYLHQESVIHGDLKPGNILMNNAFEPRITDYGLAKLQDDLPSSTSTDGTRHYSAPELGSHPRQRRSKASDVYALAGVCYAMYSGQDPYHGMNTLQIWSAAMNSPPARPVKRNSPYEAWLPIPDDLWSLLLSCWNSKREERPSINKLLRRLERMNQ